MNESKIEGILFKNIEESKQFGRKIWITGLIALCVCISLAIFNFFNVFSNKYISSIAVLIFILSIFLFAYSNFEYNLLDSKITRKVCLDIGKCLNSGCGSSLGKCLHIYEGGIWICKYYIYEEKQNVEKSIEIITDLVKEYKNGDPNERF